MGDVESFQIIAEEIVAICGENFQSAIMDGKIGENYIDHSIKCIDIEGKETTQLLDLDRTWVVYDALFIVRNNMSSGENEKWSGYRFEIHKNGKFKFNVSYGS